MRNELARGTSATTQLNAIRKFGGFGKYGSIEGRQGVRKAVAQRDEVLEQLMDFWKDVFNLSQDAIDYPNIFKILRNRSIDYSSEDLMNFSLMLDCFGTDDDIAFKAGCFLSALVNEGNDKKYTIYTSHLPYLIDCLGADNTKDIFVHGNVGDGIGIGNYAGTILVRGDAKEDAGYGATGGVIIIEGIAQTGLAQDLDGGTIIANGEVFGTVGERMRNGVVHLNSEYGCISKDFAGGRIYHKGELIIER